MYFQTLMKWSARELVQRYLAKKPAMNRADINQVKRDAHTCEIFSIWEGKHCPCCGMVLRTKPKGTQTRQRLMVVQEIKRI